MEPAERRQPTQLSDKVANARDNWISGEFGAASGMGIGARYERMLNSRMSLGVNVFWNFSIIGDLQTSFNLLRIETLFRWYPWGKTFFVGTALGFQYQRDSSHLLDSYIFGDILTRRDEALFYGFAISPEIGWKIDIGNVGGFYLLFGITYPLVFGKVELSNAYTDSGSTKLGNHSKSGLVEVNYSRLIYLGVGYTF
jgi:hypothetical protein